MTAESKISDAVSAFAEIDIGKFVENYETAKVTLSFRKGVLFRVSTDGKLCEKETQYEPKWKKLTTLQVAEIRKRFSEGGVTKVSLAKDYSVSESTIRKVIKTGELHD